MQPGAFLFYSQPIAIGTNGKLFWNRAVRPDHRSREIHEVMTMSRTVEEIIRHADELAARVDMAAPYWIRIGRGVLTHLPGPASFTATTAKQYRLRG